VRAVDGSRPDGAARDDRSGPRSKGGSPARPLQGNCRAKPASPGLPEAGSCLNFSIFPSLRPSRFGPAFLPVAARCGSRCCRSLARPLGLFPARIKAAAAELSCRVREIDHLRQNAAGKCCRTKRFPASPAHGRAGSDIPSEIWRALSVYCAMTYTWRTEDSAAGIRNGHGACVLTHPAGVGCESQPPVRVSYPPKRPFPHTHGVWLIASLNRTPCRTSLLLFKTPWSQRRRHALRADAAARQRMVVRTVVPGPG
jgi:hypothetical protein